MFVHQSLVTETDTDKDRLNTVVDQDMITWMILTLQILYYLTTANGFQ